MRLDDINNVPESEKPKYLYRGIIIGPDELWKFKFSGVPLVTTCKPIVGDNGMMAVGDGNEYGIYMSSNYDMVVGTDYGSPKGYNQDNVIGSFKIGGKDIVISPPRIGVVYKIDTENLEVKRPYITSSLKGVYNNGFVGDEWVSKSGIPETNYSIMEFRIGEDYLHAFEVLRVNGDIELAERKLKNIISSRTEELQKFNDVMQSNYKKLDDNDKKIFRKMFDRNDNTSLNYLLNTYFSKCNGELDINRLRETYKLLSSVPGDINEVIGFMQERVKESGVMLDSKISSQENVSYPFKRFGYECDILEELYLKKKSDAYNTLSRYISNVPTDTKLVGTLGDKSTGSQVRSQKKSLDECAQDYAQILFEIRSLKNEGAITLEKAHELKKLAEYYYIKGNSSLAWLNELKYQKQVAVEFIKKKQNSEELDSSSKKM